MASQPPLSDAERTDLVSYLDGELDPNTARDLEARLARDPGVRAEAETLRRTWELLDYLPRPEPSPEFTHRTLESLAVVRPLVPTARRRLPLGWAAAILLAWLTGFAGFLGYTHWAHRHDRIDPQLLADLHVIDNLQTYLLVGDVQLLRAFDTPDLFGGEDSAPAPVAQAPAASAEDLEQNRRLIERWRADPEHFARLRQDLAVLQSLPEDEQERLRRLDRSLTEEQGGQPRLRGVLGRFLGWFERLAPEDQERIRQAGTSLERVEVVRQIREREFIAQLPRSEREKVQAARNASDRAKLVARYRDESRAFRQQWAFALRPRGQGEPPPALQLFPGDFPPEVQSFIRSLRPLLTNEEAKRLDEAEGQGPLYVKTLLELTDEHAYAIPGATVRPLRMIELRPVLRQHHQNHKNEPEWKRAVAAMNRNPDFALAVTEVVRKQKLSVPQLAGTPCRPSDFDSALREAIEKRLPPALSRSEREHLQSLEGQWPEFPRELADLSRKKQVPLPGLTLPPGAPAFWDRLGQALPEVPQRKLEEFAAEELTSEEVANLTRTLADPGSLERFKEAFYRRYPSQLREQLQAEYERLLRKQASPTGK